MKYQFQNCGELLELCKKYKTSISQIAVRREMELYGKSRPQIRHQMKKVRDTMWESIQAGISSTKKSRYGLVGGNAKTAYEGLKKGRRPMSSKVAARAMAYAMAVTEENARMEKIVAFPTAGGAGVVPGVLFSTYEHMKSSKRMMLRGLFTASAIGVALLENGGTLSAAKAGCQAEVGVGCACAAAGLTEMRGGTPEQCVNAAALALKNMLGLACDPLGGLVEVPCVKRNALAAVQAIGASDLSLFCIKSVIPMDQVVRAMMSISDHMSVSIRETSLGGLAATETGRALRQRMNLKPLPKKYLYQCGKCKGCK